MQTAEVLLCQVRAAHGFLATLGEESSFKNGSRLQREALERGLADTRLTTADKTELIKMFRDGPWAPEDSDRLLGALCQSGLPRVIETPVARTPPRVGHGARGPYANMQNYETMMAYGTEKLYENLDADNAMVNIADHLILLNLRQPSERTSAVAAAWATLASTAPHRVQHLPTEILLESVRHFKKIFKQRALASVVDPNGWIARLPANPDELQTTHRELYDNVFSESPPCPAPYPQMHMNLLLQRMPCRVTRDASHQGLAASPHTEHRGARGAAETPVQMYPKRMSDQNDGDADRVPDADDEYDDGAGGEDVLRPRAS